MPDPIKLGLDYSARRISGASIKAAGYSFVFRYLDFSGQRYPALNIAEYRDLTNHGIDVHAIFEISVHDPSTGSVGGRQNAVTAVNSARAAGLPQGSTIFMCADAPTSQWSYPMSTAMAYLDGARVIIEDSGYVLGAYGFKDFIYAAQDGGHADRFWLCGAESGVRAGIHAYQWNNGRVHVDGVECDLNKLYIPMEDTPPTTAEQDDDMPNLIKGDQTAEVWLVTIEGNGGAFKVHVPTTELLTVFQTLLGKDVRVVPQWCIDYIAVLPEGATLNQQMQELLAAIGEVSDQVEDLDLGGVSEERIGEIAVDAVKDDLSD